ncbi:MAG: zonular occludens toxin domain-containing protein [Culicoidibacterales bacterium]
MISLFTGNCGSGKSLYSAKRIEANLKKRKVLANFTCNTESENFTYVNNNQLSYTYLLKYARDHHEQNKESQTLLIIDEAQIIFNSRDFRHPDRLKFLEFFAQHRKLGFDILIITQQDNAIDKQIRNLVDVHTNFVKLNNFSFLWWLPTSVFMRAEKHYASNLGRTTSVFLYNKKYSEFYNTFYLFENI